MANLLRRIVTGIKTMAMDRRGQREVKEIVEADILPPGMQEEAKKMLK